MMSENLELTLLGRVQLTWDGTPVVGFISSKVQALLCYLAITGRPHSREELASLFWSEMPDAEARANLRGALFNLRQLVAPYLAIDRQTVAFHPSVNMWVDVARFQDRIQQIETCESEDSVRSLREAVDLYCGELMQGFYVRDAPAFEEWLMAEREHLQQLAVQGLYMLAAHYLTSGEYAEAIRYTTRLIEMDPWREEAHRQLMLLLTLTGQRSAALKQYETCRQILADALRVEPTAETTTLYRRIQEGAWDTGQHGRMGARHVPVRSHKAAGQAPLPFIGRKTEYAWLFRQWDAAQSNNGVLTLVQGEAGVGKTRLVEELLRYAVGTDAMVLRGRCYQFEHEVPHQPIADVLRDVLESRPALFQELPMPSLMELTRLLPELYQHHPDLPPIPTIIDETSRQRLFESVAQVLMALVGDHPPVILFLDDLQYADPATVDILRYLCYRLHGTSLWCVGAYRSEEVDDENPLVPLIHDLERRRQIAHLQLPLLQAEAMAQLVDKLFGLEGSQHQQLVTYLNDESEGNAFMFEQLLQGLEKQRILHVTGNVWQMDIARLVNERLAIPDGVRAMVLDRLSQLPAPARALMDLAAVIGRRFDLHLLAMASNQHSHEVGEYLEILLTRALIREIGPTQSSQQEDLADGHGERLLLPPHASQNVRYEFTHKMVQRVIYANLSYGSQQRLLERIIAASDRLHQNAALIALSRKHLDKMKHTSTTQR